MPRTVNDGGTLLQTKASVKKLKSKKLTDFIENSTGFNVTTAAERQLSDQQLLQNAHEEIPVLCIRRGGTTKAKLKKNSQKLQEILMSYKIFKAENSEHDFPDYITEENVDFM